VRVRSAGVMTAPGRLRCSRTVRTTRDRKLSASAYRASVNHMTTLTHHSTLFPIFFRQAFTRSANIEVQSMGRRRSRQSSRRRESDRHLMRLRRIRRRRHHERSENYFPEYAGAHARSMRRRPPRRSLRWPRHAASRRLAVFDLLARLRSCAVTLALACRLFVRRLSTLRRRCRRRIFSARSAAPRSDRIDAPTHRRGMLAELFQLDIVIRILLDDGRSVFRLAADGAVI
jgi:hypothetical protein